MKFFVTAAVILLIALLIYRQGGEDRVRDQREETLQRSKDISDAVKDSDAAPDWRDQLRDRHQ
ncbi:hypothetical protein JQX09_18155 [Sulfitobacter pseudonitzschiae]|uniref:Uncharacterized protein n=1 Tax=Pseudosulfitobacter pseudonitzschiae TaxID=1402135 RepID=A0A9Q2P4V4_9RHOB|nr:hypothetical protein [Pseudosulfitobacter pseudonitzschiae]MBM2293852.1 hypothetical protein [Pseudosulfitobacter pseudonitzschiae]MBM2298769.1 hypothetical protein [Pseudosulfitobacter pseudonitzschiae]MBM2303684.1 hypothetical protein [Pseudosulfitobacter pseudonitzschiae]MBM2313466.1 hypothetical protein [Pseudosulfitobacter pseudonitzschiae]MBM2318380.1 hypothetical protein [Pseudosulfitobacter pseudonitzschiae]